MIARIEILRFYVFLKCTCRVLSYWRKPNTNDINISLKYTSSQPKLIKKKNDDIGKFNVTGSFQEGGKLSANVEDIDGLNSQNISYQWFYGSSHTTKENGELKTTWKNIDFIDGQSIRIS